MRWFHILESFGYNLNNWAEPLIIEMTVTMFQEPKGLQKKIVTFVASCVKLSVERTFIQALWSQPCRVTCTIHKIQSSSLKVYVKISKWKLIYMNFMNRKCTWHLFWEVRPGGSRVMPLFEIVKYSYIDDSIVCIVKNKVDNNLTNSPYVSFLCDITTDILVAKKLGVYLKSEL